MASINLKGSASGEITISAPAVAGANTLTIPASTGTMIINDGTGSIEVPAGTTAERPVSPAQGDLRYNTTESQLEIYNGTDWQIVDTSFYPYAADFLALAGGGGSGRTDIFGGGGGGGGLRTSYGATSGGGASEESQISLVPNTTYTITVGAGGAGAGATYALGVNGSNSSIAGSGLTTITSLGGGGGNLNST